MEGGHGGGSDWGRPTRSDRQHRSVQHHFQGCPVPFALHPPKMHLAQELVDYIIDFLHDDPRTLTQACLVSSAWVGRTRTHICESLKITRFKFWSLNPSYLTPLCGYVKMLHLTWPGDLIDPSPVFDCFEQSEPHTLAIDSCELQNFSEYTMQRCFENFPCGSITTLELYDISPTHRTLLTLLSLFQNVDDLTISVNRWWKDRPDVSSFGGSDNETTQCPSPPRLRGHFKFFDPPDRTFSGFHRGKLLRTIATLPLQFQVVSLEIREQSWEEISTFLRSCSRTVRKVFAELPYRKSQPYILSTAPCTKT